MSAINPSIAIYGRQIDEILRAQPGQRAQQAFALFDAYRVLNTHDREDFVIAMIGRLLTEHTRRTHSAATAANVVSLHPERTKS